MNFSTVKWDIFCGQILANLGNSCETIYIYIFWAAWAAWTDMPLIYLWLLVVNMWTHGRYSLQSIPLAPIGTNEWLLCYYVMLHTMLLTWPAVHWIPLSEIFASTNFCKLAFTRKSLSCKNFLLHRMQEIFIIAHGTAYANLSNTTCSNLCPCHRLWSWLWEAVVLVATTSTWQCGREPLASHLT